VDAGEGEDLRKPCSQRRIAGPGDGILITEDPPWADKDAGRGVEDADDR